MAPQTQRGIGLLVALPFIIAACGAGVSPTPGTTGASGPLPGGSLGPTATATPTPTPTSAPTPTPATLPTMGMWARLAVAGPAPAAREAHTWTVDPDGRIAYL